MDTKGYNNQKILVFAGTSEGRRLAEAFAERKWQRLADFCVATEYGTEMLRDLNDLSIIEGRQTAEKMRKMLHGGVYGMVIDATHPYATVVTGNIRSACTAENVPYLRLLRSTDSLPQGVITVSSAKEAAVLVHQREDKVLLTTGAKELFQYSGVRDIADRIIARVLPSVASIEACLGAGIASKHIVAMQGPFTKEMNLATMKQYGCTCLVTKHTGKPGGFDDKLAVLEAGYTVIVIEKPAEETGVSFETVMRKAERFYEQ